ncbi:MAG: HXXEE domain-containing protein [Bacteroidota bacterium]
MTAPDMKRLWWYIPVVLAIHNCEEALTMPQWMSVHLWELREKVWLMDELQFSPKQLYLSLILVTVVPFLLTYFCRRGVPSQRKNSVLLTLQSIIFWNAFMPHIGGVFVLGMYNPGVVTALACNLPFSVYLFNRVRQEGTVTDAVLRNCIIAGLVLYLPLVYLNHLIAQAITML